MEILRPIPFEDVLVAWALHEYHGKHRRLAAQRADLRPEQVSELAFRILAQHRRGVIQPMVEAGIRECVRVRVTPEDTPLIRVMGADPVENWSKNKLAEESESAEWVKQLAASQEPIRGPLMAIARRAAGPITIFDGMHRLAAWVDHIKHGRGYPLEVNVVVTERPSSLWELPPGS